MEELNEIKEIIAKHHGIYVGDDDPVLILHTLNQHLINDNTNVQKQLLEQYKYDLDLINANWQQKSLDNASRILNASLISSKETLANALKENVKLLNKTSVHQMNELELRLLDVVHRTRLIARLNLITAFIFFFTLGLFMLHR